MDKRFAALLLSIVLTITLFTGCAGKPKQPQTDASSQSGISSQTDVLSQNDASDEISSAEQNDEDVIVYGEEYNDVLSVSAYLYEWEQLPPNYITKDEAEDLGWISNKGNLWDVAYGKSIGGDRFGNREGLLPEGENYCECDIDYAGGYRDAKRLVYSIDDWDIYYTENHYESFVQVYSYEDGYVMDENIVFE